MILLNADYPFGIFSSNQVSPGFMSSNNNHGYLGLRTRRLPRLLGVTNSTPWEGFWESGYTHSENPPGREPGTCGTGDRCSATKPRIPNDMRPHTGLMSPWKP